MTSEPAKRSLFKIFPLAFLVFFLLCCTVTGIASASCGGSQVIVGQSMIFTQWNWIANQFYQKTIANPDSYVSGITIQYNTKMNPEGEIDRSYVIERYIDPGKFTPAAIPDEFDPFGEHTIVVHYKEYDPFESMTPEERITKARESVTKARIIIIAMLDKLNAQPESSSTLGWLLQ